MELNKFEKKANEKLKERQIKPSAGSWVKLEAKLNTEENKTSTKPWKYIAAVAVLLIVATFMWNDNSFESPQVVEDPVKEVIEKSEIEQGFPQENKIQIALEKNNSKGKVSSGNQVRISSSKETLINKKIVPEFAVSEEERYKRTIVLETISLEPPVFEEKLIQSKLEQVIAATAKNGEASMDEVDVLLAQAAAEISKERSVQMFASNSEVSANALLAEVEDEIYQSFKARVFEVLKEGYLKAKTAVANRNY